MFAKKGGFSKGKSDLTQSLINDDSNSNNTKKGDLVMKNMDKRKYKSSTIADEETIQEGSIVEDEDIIWPEDDEVNWDVILVFENPDYAENLNQDKVAGYMTMKEVKFV